MNRIVREHYPVEKLPEDLRAGLPAGQTVTVTVEKEETQPAADWLPETVLEALRHPKPMTLDEARALIGPRNVSPNEAVERIRNLRDEWD